MLSPFCSNINCSTYHIIAILFLNVNEGIVTFCAYYMYQIRKEIRFIMNERQYILEHMLYLVQKLQQDLSPNERKNTENALLFYAKELKHTERKIMFLQ